MAWVPLKDRDTAWWVTKKLYKCRIPNLQTMSPAYLKYFGTPDSGDERTNEQMRNELIDVQISIGQMAEYYDEGVQISIPDPKVTREIYERIFDHLQAWKKEMEETINPGGLPAVLDDLMKLDRFAAKLHPHAKAFFDKDFVESKFVRRMSGLLRIRREDFFSPEQKAEQNAEKPEHKHNPFSDAFQARKDAIGGRRWK